MEALSCCFSFSGLVAGNPLIQCQRLIVRINAKTIDHIAGNVSPVSFHVRSHGFPDPSLKFLQQPLIPRIMDVTVEHIGLRIPLFVQTVLAIIEQDRVMARKFDS